jgi:hypothetical protein
VARALLPALADASATHPAVKNKTDLSLLSNLQWPNSRPNPLAAFAGRSARATLTSSSAPVPPGTPGQSRSRYRHTRRHPS